MLCVRPLWSTLEVLLALCSASTVISRSSPCFVFSLDGQLWKFTLPCVPPRWSTTEVLLTSCSAPVVNCRSPPSPKVSVEEDLRYIQVSWLFIILSGKRSVVKVVLLFSTLCFHFLCVYNYRVVL